MDQRGGFTRDGVARGLKAAMAITLGLSPFGLVVGMTADQAGLSLAETLLMSGLVFAGTSQLVALQLWADPAPVLAATLACLVINLRMTPMGAALAPVLDRARGIRLWGTLALLVDNSFALAIAEMRAGRRDVGFLFGASAGMWLNWMAMCAVGHLFGAALRLPPGHPVFFAASAAVLALLVQLWRGRSDLQPWLLAGCIALLVQGAGLGAPWPVLLGAFAGAGYGAWRDGRRAA
ncbi:AzlC family ABC transporter permease [Paracraurococcus lichenis]|uniref:AzlC family ABC transporter permease n=1 Tax=Paracraurococcus lichenis TaxID=3064888 RepID=A0ABT9DW87_9PROT|nr:AzlC family ABC transporter permease [Paracraurococcus sp. LOR1-02]MDO9708159.1 AzlC family ABC transporter permease [Paracraurococcus sp. LOR1-02]